MTKFKVFELDGYFEYTVNTRDTEHAVRILKNMFGESVRFVIII